jgi:Methyltransferase domain
LNRIALIMFYILPSEVMKNKQFFSLWEKKGFHVLAVHFYSPIPEVRSLPTNLWTQNSELIGLDLNESGQIELLSAFSKFKNDYGHFQVEKPVNNAHAPYIYFTENGMFPSVDGEILYCMIRYFKPKRILEIGSGNSTLVSAQAILKNKQEDPSYECELTAVEPYPTDFLEKGFPGFSTLIKKSVQEIPISVFKLLQEQDILFIDSSHVLKIGSDVQYLYLEILPRLKKGVIVHCHDIFLPAEYPKEWIIEERRFWNEQYLLQAFLTFNESFQVLWAGQFMHIKHPDLLEKFFKTYNRRTKSSPGSFWIRRTK